MGPIFDYQVLVKRKESAFDFYLNFKLKACKPQEFHTKNQYKKDNNKKTSLGINYILKPYIESAYISPQPASPPHSI